MTKGSEDDSNEKKINLEGGAIKAVKEDDHDLDVAVERQVNAL